MELLRTAENRFAGLKNYPFNSNYVDVDGIRIHYLDEGPKDSPTILLLHGVPTWSYLYRHMIPVLVNSGLRVIAPDLAGFGKSDKPVNPDWYCLINHCAIIKNLTKILDLNNIILFGQDWGSMIGLRAAMDDPKRYSGIIISNGGLPAGKEKQPIAFRLWKLFSRYSPWFPIDLIINAGTVKKLSKEVRKAYLAPFPYRNHKVAPRIMPARVPVAPDNQEAKLNNLAWSKLAEWRKPFLTAFGDSDPITKGWERIFQETIPGALNQNHSILNAGHFVQEDEGIALAEIIINFIEENKIGK